jgi:polyvinyl alcohol dehydrogenase (cytochrome)
VFSKGYLMVLALLTMPAMAQNGAGAPGATVFAQHCAQCHDSGAARIPTRAVLESLTQQEILRALESGPMQAQGAQLAPPERLAVAQFLSRREGGAALGPPIRTAMCKSAAPPLDLSAHSWNGWGASVTNERLQPRAAAGLNAADVSKLELRWAFGFPNDTSAAVQPTVVGRWVFVGSTSGRVYALDLQQGCIYWTFDAAAQVRSAISVVRLSGGGGDEYAVVFGDRGAHVYSLDARTGHLRWMRRVGDGTAGETGSVTAYAGRLYVPLTGGNEGAGGDLDGCCRAHGAVAALDANSGQILWQSSSLLAPPQPTRRNAAGKQLYGPSGASVWSAPTIDARKHVLYVGTGDGHSDPSGPSSDSIIAYDLDSGSKVWVHQATPHDSYTGGCDRPDLVGCPYENGPDFDFGEPPALVSLGNGQRLLVIGQKSGLVYGFDPDHEGRELWRTKLGTGGVLGGIDWGVASDGRNAYVAVSDHLDYVERDARLNPHAGGLAAVRLTDGKVLWRTNVSGCADHEGSLQLEHPPIGSPDWSVGKHAATSLQAELSPTEAPPDFGCSPAQSAAVTVIPGVVFSGSEDGHLRAYAAETGHVIWDFDSARDFETVNYVDAHGGSIDVGGPAVVDGMVLTTSGYAQWGEMHGNVLLAFSVAAH